jgi:hypothetical protein
MLIHSDDSSLILIWFQGNFSFELIFINSDNSKLRGAAKKPVFLLPRAGEVGREPRAFLI